MKTLERKTFPGRVCAHCGYGFIPQTPWRVLCSEHCHGKRNGWPCNCENCKTMKERGKVL